MAHPNKSRRPKSEEYDDFEDTENSLGGSNAQERVRQLMFDLLSRWHWIALGLVLGLLASLYYLSKAPRRYDATSTLLVKQQTASVLKKSDDEEIDLKSTEALNTITARIKRPELFLRVASRSDIRSLPGLVPQPVNWLPEWASSWLDKGNFDTSKQNTSPPPPEVLAKQIAGMIDAAATRNTRLVNITASHTSPIVAKSIADAIASEYIADLSGARSEGRTTAFDILKTGSEQARTQLQTAQNALSNYIRALATVKDLETRETIVTDLKRKYKDKHPKMIAAQLELQAHQNKFLAEFEDARQAIADKEYWKNQEAELNSHSDNPAARLQTSRRLLVARAAVLESEIASQNNVFNSLLTRMQETDINQQGDESEVEISSFAQLPDKISSPKKPLVLAAGAFLGIGGGFVLALLLTRLDNKFHTVAQIERETALPILAAISDIQPKILSEISRKKKIDFSSVSEMRKNWDPRLVFREGLSGTTFAEMFRVLRASVSLLGDEKKRKITLFSSALPGEGKSFVSCNYALAAAQSGKRTLLIDLDLRKPSIHKTFGLKRDSHPYGATELLAKQTKFEDAIFTQTGEENLHLMLSGKQAPNPGELLNSSNLEEVLRTAAENYDVVVIDSAPLLAVPDTRIIVPLVDNFCLVSRAEYVPKGAVRRALELLANDKNSPVGLVFNGFVEKRTLIGQNYSYGNYQTNRYGRAYRYGYGNYGSYGQEE